MHMFLIKEKKDRKEIYMGSERPLVQDEFQDRKMFDEEGLLNLRQREALYTHTNIGDQDRHCPFSVS